MGSPNNLPAEPAELKLEDFMRTARNASGILIEGDETPNARLRREESAPLSGLALEHQSSDDAIALTPPPAETHKQ